VDDALHTETPVILELKPRGYSNRDGVIPHEESFWLLLNGPDIPAAFQDDVLRIFAVRIAKKVDAERLGYGRDYEDWYIRGRFGDQDLLIVCTTAADEAVGLCRNLADYPPKAEIATEDFRFVQDPEVKERLDYWPRITSLLRREGIRHGFRDKETAA
jgi:hypothetical protein